MTSEWASRQLGPDETDFLASALLPALNNTKMYSYHVEPQEGPHIGNGVVIQCHLSDCIRRFVISAALATPDFLNVWLRAVVKVSWGAIPLYHVFSATSSLESCPMNEETFQQLMDFASTEMKCQEPLARTAIRGYILDVVFANSVGDATRDVDFLSVFANRRDALVYGTRLWEKATAWVRQTTTETLTTKLEAVSNSGSPVSVKAKEAKKVALLALLSLPNIKTFVKILVSKLEDKSQRPYTCQLPEILVLCDIVDMTRPPEDREGKEFLTYSLQEWDSGILDKIWAGLTGVEPLLFRYICTVNDPALYPSVAVRVTSLLAWLWTKNQHFTDQVSDLEKLLRLSTGVRALAIHRCLCEFSKDFELVWKDQPLEEVEASNPEDQRLINEILGEHQCTR